MKVARRFFTIRLIEDNILKSDFETTEKCLAKKWQFMFMLLQIGISRK